MERLFFLSLGLFATACTGIAFHQIGQWEVVPVEDHFFGECGAEFAFGGGELGVAAEVVQFAGVGFEVVEFVDGTGRGEVGGGHARREFAGGVGFLHLFPGLATGGVDR